MGDEKGRVRGGQTRTNDQSMTVLYPAEPEYNRQETAVIPLKSSKI